MALPPSSSGAMARVRGVIGFALLIVAAFGVRPLAPANVDVDFALIAVLFSAVRLRPGLGAVIGFLVGFALDAMAPGSFGAHALALTLIGYGASWLKAVFFADHVGLTGLFVFTGKWLLDIALVLLTGVSTGISLVITLLVWSPLSAALTAGVAVLLLVMFRPLYRPQSL